MQLWRGGVLKILDLVQQGKGQLGSVRSSHHGYCALQSCTLGL
jgi:hypothetical protein